MLAWGAETQICSNKHYGQTKTGHRVGQRGQRRRAQILLSTPRCLLVVEMQDFVDVQFDFFDPNPSVDYHALKRLLMQLFQSDAELFHLQELVELILSQPAVGTTIKTEGTDSDPYAILTVLNIHVHQVRIIILCNGIVFSEHFIESPIDKSFGRVCTTQGITRSRLSFYPSITTPAIQRRYEKQPCRPRHLRASRKHACSSHPSDVPHAVG
jgi:hypothetical protein